MVWAGRLRVLFADDGALMRRLFQETFEAHEKLEIVGYAKNATETIDLFRARSPHVVLVDEDLLGVKGSEIIHQLRDVDNEVVLIGIVSPTAHGREEGTEMIIQGANSYIEKPKAIGHPLKAKQAYMEVVLPELIAWGDQSQHTNYSI